MKSVERVVTTLEHEEPDKVPMFDFLYNRISLRKFAGDSKLTPSRIMKVWRSLGFDLVCLGFDSPKGYRPRWLCKDIFVDEWGVKNKYGGDMSWYLDGMVKTQPDLDDLTIPDPHADGRSRTLEWALRSHGDRVACAVAIPGVFTQAWAMTGFPAFITALYRERRFARNLLSVVNDYFIEMGKIAIDLGAEFLWVADDFGGSKGPMISPPYFQTFILPHLRRMVRSFKRQGVWVFLHCDGNVMPLMEDIAETGIDAFHPTERKTGMDLRVMKESHGERITLIGNVEASHLITQGSFQDIDVQIRECFQTGAPGGGYVFASDHSIHPAISAERARFVYQRAERYRKYRR